eukprot:2490174-Rhodomonas_salina.1
MHTQVPGYPSTQGVGSSTTSSSCTNCDTGEGTRRGGRRRDLGLGKGCWGGRGHCCGGCGVAEAAGAVTEGPGGAGDGEVLGLVLGSDL